MNSDSLAAKKILDSDKTNLVLCYKGVAFRCNKKVEDGLIDFYKSGCDFKEFSSASTNANLYASIIIVKLGIKNIRFEGERNVYDVDEISPSIVRDNNKCILCKRCVAAGAEYVKTSTGFGSGGATAEDVKLMKNALFLKEVHFCF